MDTAWEFSDSREITTWLQVCTMDGFLELESLNSLNSKLSETDTWYVIFQELAEQALSADASGNDPGAEVLFHQCKDYLGQAAEGVAEAVDQSPRSAIALCWVYLALANFYRYSRRDYWKAVEYLLLLLSTRGKIVSSSDSINEIRFAVCLTVFELVEHLEDCKATRDTLVGVLLEEARDIVEEWKILDDEQVMSSFAYMLKLGYTKLGRNEAASFWDQWFTTLMMQTVITRDNVLDRLSESRSSVGFQQQAENIQVCVRKFCEFGAKATSATGGGHISEALFHYKQCEAVVRDFFMPEEGGDVSVKLNLAKMLVWAHERMGRAYRLDLRDFSQALYYYRLALMNFMEIEKLAPDLRINIRRLNMEISSIMYEEAHVMITLSDMKRRRLIAEAVLMARKFLPTNFDGSMSDLAVREYICVKLIEEYKEMGRVGEANFWNEERLKLVPKTEPRYKILRFRSAQLLEQSVGFQQKVENIQVCIRKFGEFGAKATSATGGGHISDSSEITTWLQVCTMDGFLELESLNSLNSKLSETDTWYVIFQELAEQAFIAYASGEYSLAEVPFHQCKERLEKTAEGVEEAVDQSPRSAIALCWVYLGLANVYRYSLRDYWKAVEYLLLLLSTREKIVSSSYSINEIRFALCLTVFEWVEYLKDCKATRDTLVVVPLEEARDIVEEWKILDDAQVMSSFAYMLKLGYTKLGRNEAASFWDQWFTTLMMQTVIIGNSFLDRLSESRSSVGFHQQAEIIQVCVRKFCEFGAKAVSATSGGHISEALVHYKQCEAVVREVLSEEVVQEDVKVNLTRMLVWAYDSMGRAYRLDLRDFSQALGCYRTALTNFMEIEKLAPDLRIIRRLNMEISSIMYEEAHVTNTLSDEEKRRLIAEAVLMARKCLPTNWSRSDLAVRDYICRKLVEEYDEMGRFGESYFWNEETMKLVPKTEPRYERLRIRSAQLLEQLGETEKARKIVKPLLGSFKSGVKSHSTQDSLSGMLSLAHLAFVSALHREIYLKHCEENPTSNLPPMTDAVIDDESSMEVQWVNEFLNLEPTQAIKDEQGKVSWNLLSRKGHKLYREGNYMEAIDCFRSCLKLCSGDDRNINYVRMGCHWYIALCHEGLSQKAGNFALKIHPNGTDEYAEEAFPEFESRPAAYDHYRKSIDNFKEALHFANRRDDIYSMAEINKWLGFLIIPTGFLGRLLRPGSDDGVYERLKTALDHYRASARNVNRFLYSLRAGLRDVDQLWISVLEREDSVSRGAFYRIQRLIIDIAKRESKTMPTRYSKTIKQWSIEALLWAERSHSRTLAFKLTERNMGSSTRSELQKFDMDVWEEPWRRLRESGDVSGPGTVMVEFNKSEDSVERFIGYAVTHDGDVQMWVQNQYPEEDLEILLRKLNDHMSQKVGSELPNEEVMQILENLYKAFFSHIQVVLDNMKEHHKLVICANKSLAGVPFAALRNPDTKKFLIERHTVVCTPSLRILKQCDQRLKALRSCPLMESTGAALVLGDPAFNLEQDRLRFTEDEANTIADILGHQNVQVLKGKSALKKEVLDWVQLASTSGKYQALMHLATHGKGADDNFKEGALQFADPQVKAWPPSGSTPEFANSPCEQDNVYSREERVEEASSSTSVSPLQAQKYVFQTGNPRGSGPTRRRSNSCFLTSEEIMQDFEWRMLLVVLSACETAKGEVKSEGTLNLARALLISGVPSTIVSQWKVDDASAPVLMEGLYSAMKEGKDVASALRASMVAMITDDVNKYQVHQWAPFVVMGLGTVTLPEQFLPQRRRAIVGEMEGDL